MDSILTSIKKLIGITEDYKHFDVDLIMHINSVLMVLTQLGVGPSRGFMIFDDTATWDDFLPEGSNLEIVKTYLYLKVRLVFDISTLSSAEIKAMEQMVNEFEWRISVAAESGEYLVDLT